jgi:hypothetical protein
MHPGCYDANTNTVLYDTPGTKLCAGPTRLLYSAINGVPWSTYIPVLHVAAIAIILL